MTWYSDEESSKKVVSCKNDIGVTTITQINNTTIDTSTFEIHFSPMRDTPIGFFANLQYAFIIGIDSAECNGKPCYVIKGEGYLRYVDKETGLVVREIEKSHDKNMKDVVRDYDYAFNIVKDSDITITNK
jgi:hypothetical protein